MDPAVASIPPEKVCQQCSKAEWKYKCPKCELKTCSLACSKQHKVDAECDGKKSDQKTISSEKWTKLPSALESGCSYDEETSIEDKEFLNGVKSVVAESRDKKRHHENGNQSVSVDNEKFVKRGKFDEKRVPKMLQRSQQDVRVFVNECRKRNIRVALAPIGLERSRLNQSKYDHMAETIFWTVRVCFDLTSVDSKSDLANENHYFVDCHRLAESITLGTVLKQFLQPKKGGPISEMTLDLHKLAPFIDVGLNGIGAFLKVESHDGVKSFYKLDVSKSLLDNLYGKSVVEFPTVFVVLQGGFDSYPEIPETEAADITAKLFQFGQRLTVRAAQVMFIQFAKVENSAGCPVPAGPNTAPGLPKLQRFDGGHERPEFRARGRRGRGRFRGRGFRRGGPGVPRDFDQPQRWQVNNFGQCHDAWTGMFRDFTRGRGGGRGRPY